MEYDPQPSTSQGLAGADDSGSDDDYMEIFDPDKFVRDGNDIRFQLPSNNAALSLSKNLDEVQRKTTSIKRRNTTRVAIVRRRSTKPPPIVNDDAEDRSSKPRMAASRLSPADYDVSDGGSEEVENLVSSEDHFNELQNIRSLTLPMGQKRDYREHIRQRAYVQPSGLSLARHAATKKWMKIRRNVNEITHYTDMWRGTLKEIEGQFGAGIMEYFRLVKWMIFLNLLLCVPVLFIIIPQFVLSPQLFDGVFADSIGTTSPASSALNAMTTSTPSVTAAPMIGPMDLTGTRAMRLKQLNSLVHDYELARNCSKTYKDMYEKSKGQEWYFYLLDFVQGTGWFEHTPLFYGYYFNKTSEIGGEIVQPWYNMSVAYVLASMGFFCISLTFIVSSTSSGLEHNVLADRMVNYQCINQVFAGWDFGLYKEKSARVKKSLIRLEMMRDIAEKKRLDKHNNRSSFKNCIIYLIRVIVNLVVICILVGCAAAVYFTQRESDKRLGPAKKAQVESEKQTPVEAFTDLVWQYLPSVLITVMYAVFPILFKKLATLERYYPATEQNVTIARIVLLRLGTVFLLLLPIYINVIACEKSETRDHCGSCDHQCWETFIGQQIYKLVLLDFFVIVGVVFFVEFPRKALWKRFKHKKSISYIGQEEFDIPVNVMDMVYTQTLCWIGAFYSPLLPFITLFKVIVFFFVRKLSLFHNQRPAAAPYRASSMNLFFKCVLTLAFFIAILAIGITVGVIPPSRSCGPFRIHSTINKVRGGSTDAAYTMFGAIAESLLLLPEVPRDAVTFITSSPFFASLIIILLLLIYVYAARSTGQLRLVELLRETLKREEKDKHWLLGKVNRTLRRELSSKPHPR